jgi:ketosteroid isomerase-like protein
MSQENVEVVRRSWAAWERRELEALFALYDPAIIWENHGGPIELRGTYVGHEGVRQTWRELLEPFENFDAHADQFIDAGNSVVVGWRIKGRGKASGIDVETSGWSVHEVQNGFVVRVDLFQAKVEALEAVGLSE